MEDRFATEITFSMLITNGGCGSCPIPSFQRRGGREAPEWLVSKGREASLYARVAVLILFEITNHPVCAAKERDLLIEAQPPLLEKEGTGPAAIICDAAHRPST